MLVYRSAATHKYVSSLSSVLCLAPRCVLPHQCVLMVERRKVNAFSKNKCGVNCQRELMIIGVNFSVKC